MSAGNTYSANGRACACGPAGRGKAYGANGRAGVCGRADKQNNSADRRAGACRQAGGRKSGNYGANRRAGAFRRAAGRNIKRCTRAGGCSPPGGQAEKCTVQTGAHVLVCGRKNVQCKRARGCLRAGGREVPGHGANGRAGACGRAPSRKNIPCKRAGGYLHAGGKAHGANLRAGGRGSLPTVMMASPTVNKRAWRLAIERVITGDGALTLTCHKPDVRRNCRDNCMTKPSTAMRAMVDKMEFTWCTTCPHSAATSETENPSGDTMPRSDDLFKEGARVHAECWQMQPTITCSIS